MHQNFSFQPCGGIDYSTHITDGLSSGSGDLSPILSPVLSYSSLFYHCLPLTGSNLQCLEFLKKLPRLAVTTTATRQQIILLAVGHYLTQIFYSSLPPFADEFLVDVNSISNGTHLEVNTKVT